ncbi:hypothetical protein NCCP28_36080 [Niallia sp. NCCP-28]|nr:hypothetical protein NCCP28_36080 [Niallia sp. NCCP-28]
MCPLDAIRFRTSKKRRKKGEYCFSVMREKFSDLKIKMNKNLYKKQFIIQVINLSICTTFIEIYSSMYIIHFDLKI